MVIPTRVFCRILHFDENHEIQVMPHVVLSFDVLIKGDGLVVKVSPWETTNEAGVV